MRQLQVVNPYFYFQIWWHQDEEKGKQLLRRSRDLGVGKKGSMKGTPLSFRQDVGGSVQRHTGGNLGASLPEQFILLCVSCH